MWLYSASVPSSLFVQSKHSISGWSRECGMQEALASWRALPSYVRMGVHAFCFLNFMFLCVCVCVSCRCVCGPKKRRWRWCRFVVHARITETNIRNYMVLMCNAFFVVVVGILSVKNALPTSNQYQRVCTSKCVCVFALARVRLGNWNSWKANRWWRVKELSV